MRRFIERLFAGKALDDRALLITALQDILSESRQINNRLNDPTGDRLGTNSRSPTADDFNDLDGRVVSIAMAALYNVGSTPTGRVDP
jgi:hypothetical protein